MLTKKKILFLTGTRADFGKLKSLITICNKQPGLDVHIFATGMHMHNKYGYTVNEIEKCGFENIIYKFINYTSESSMDLTLAKTIEGLSAYVKEEEPDLIVVHGDRVEALAGSIVGALNNILVAHIEGGEVSGTIDELIRHAVSKMSHIHFVANESAKKRLVQMGELEKNIYIIGSPDIDIMFSDKLPPINEVLDYYNIPFKKFAILMFHPVTTEESQMAMAAENIVDAVLKDDTNYIVIYPNNDLGHSHILRAYERLKGNPRFAIFPSLRFEYFLVLLSNSLFMIGNSSSGIRECPYYGVPSIDIGTRQKNRGASSNIQYAGYSSEEIIPSIKAVKLKGRYTPEAAFGSGNSDELFLSIISDEAFWQTPKQKQFIEIVHNSNA